MSLLSRSIIFSDAVDACFFQKCHRFIPKQLLNRDIVRKWIVRMRLACIEILSVYSKSAVNSGDTVKLSEKIDERRQHY
jgi:hypothetical protein